jgi:chloramphenicol 3-O phosphotransferase
MPQRRLIVITGSSGVGKSTLARALQEELLPDQWLHLSVDSILYCLPGSVVQQVNQHNDHAAVDSEAIVAAAYACARTLLGLGHKVVFDAVILSQKGAQGLLRAFDGFDPVLVTLSCSWEEIERRTRARGDRTLAEAEHGYRSAAGCLAADYTIDTTSASPEELAVKLARAVRGKTGEA